MQTSINEYILHAIKINALLKMKAVAHEEYQIKKHYINQTFYPVSQHEVIVQLNLSKNYTHFLVCTLDDIKHVEKSAVAVFHCKPI